MIANAHLSLKRMIFQRYMYLIVFFFLTKHVLKCLWGLLDIKYSSFKSNGCLFILKLFFYRKCMYITTLNINIQYCLSIQDV